MFQDLTIIELASVLAGPLTGTFFAELSARVIKIENTRTGGDITRKWKLPSEDKDSKVSAYYCAANYNKEVVFLDLTTPDDYDRLIGLVRSADVVIVNYKAGAAQKLGVDYEAIKKVNKEIIYASLTGFGHADKRPAYDVVLQAESGFMSMNGEKGRGPVKMPVALIDVLAAHHMKEAILCALIRKLKTGKGSSIEISLYDAALASLANQATNWLMAGKIAGRMGTQHPNIAPYGDMFDTKDERVIVLAIGTDRQFGRLAQVLDMDVASFASNFQRLSKRAQMNEIIASCIRELESSWLTKQFDEHLIPYGIVKDIREVLSDPLAKKMLLREIIDDKETVRMKTALV